LAQAILAQAMARSLPLLAAVAMAGACGAMGAERDERSLQVAKALMGSAVAAGASRQVAAATAVALWRVVLGQAPSLELPSPDVEVQVEARLAAIRPCLVAQEAAARRHGTSRHSAKGLVDPVVVFRRNVGVHAAFGEDFASMSDGEFRRRQRGGAKTQAVVGSSAQVVVDVSTCEGESGDDITRRLPEYWGCEVGNRLGLAGQAPTTVQTVEQIGVRAFVQAILEEGGEAKQTLLEAVVEAIQGKYKIEKTESKVVGEYDLVEVSTEEVEPAAAVQSPAEQAPTEEQTEEQTWKGGGCAGHPGKGR